MQQQPAPPPTPAPYPGGYPAATGTNTMAVISLASGIGSWFVLPLIGGVVAVVTGYIAKKEIRQTGEQGDGLATIGMVLGYLHLAVVALLLIFLVLLFAGVFAAIAAGVATGSH
jgi:hypothetical protein